MKERPILFSGEMVRAILDDRKTMTRRVVKPPFEIHANGFITRRRGNERLCPYACPYGKPGDRLWVRETWTYDNKEYVQTYKDEPWRGMPDIGTAEVYYRATERTPDAFPRWRPSIFMPRWASRITLEIANVRVERLNDISEEDAKREGVESNFDEGVVYYGPLNKGHADARIAFSWLWDSINAKRGYSWKSNPWVWVVEFERIKEQGRG